MWSRDLLMWPVHGAPPRVVRTQSPTLVVHSVVGWKKEQCTNPVQTMDQPVQPAWGLGAAAQCIGNKGQSWRGFGG